jgi:ABC-2 type transport system permease protein
MGNGVVSGARVFLFGGLTSHRALFNFRHPSVYIPTMLGGPAFQVLFFVYLGRYTSVADDRYFVIGNAIQATAMAGVFGMVMSLANEREFGTLSSILATPANRLALFWGRAVPVVGYGLVSSGFAFAVGFLVLGIRMPLAAAPAMAGTVVLSAVSCTMFGLALGSVAMRARDLWVGSNLTYQLMLLLCGGNVPPAVLPHWLASIGQGLPLTHGIQAARELAAGARLSDVDGLIGAEALIAAGYAALGYGLLRLFELENRRRASLGAA